MIDRQRDNNMSDRDAEIEALKTKLASAEASLASATQGYKKMRQMRGAAAHKRVWHFEEQMQKWSSVVELTQAELAALTGNGTAE